jgi:adenylyl-sulfate kinase
MSSSNVTVHLGALTRADRARVTGTEGATVWFTGLSGSGKSTLACAVEHRLIESGRVAYRLDGDNLRTGLNGDLDFSREAREENCRRVAEVAQLFADAGLISLVAVISPYAESRRQARRRHEESGIPFVEVYLAATASRCATRDPKGLYAQASAGQIDSFTGVDDPYEIPESPDLALDPETAVDDAVDLVLGLLVARVGSFGPAGPMAERSTPG